MPVHVVQHPLVEDVLARLRDKTTPSEEFRRLTHRVALLLVAEATRDLPLQDVTTRWWPRAGRRPWRSSSAAPKRSACSRSSRRPKGSSRRPWVPERPQVHPASPTARLDSITITGAVSRR